jgi:hypothetical protein
MGRMLVGTLLSCWVIAAGGAGHGIYIVPVPSALVIAEELWSGSAAATLTPSPWIAPPLAMGVGLMGFLVARWHKLETSI